MYTDESRDPCPLAQRHARSGPDADITLIDPDLEWTFRKEHSFSQSRNTPFDGWELKGRAVRTIVGGKTVWRM